MTGAKRQAVYLDSCVFISMITGEKRKGMESQAVAGLVSMIDSRKIIPVTSTLTRVEVLECNLTPQQSIVLKKLLSPPKVQIKEPTIAVMDLAHEIRNYYLMLRKTGASDLPTVDTPDAIHVATAIIYKCAAMFTFDEIDNDRGSRKKRALIPLSGSVCGKYDLPITKPLVDQGGLSFGGGG